VAIRFDPSKPLNIELSFDSPQVVSYNLWHRPPGGVFTLFAHGTDEEGVEVTSHRHQLTGLPPGTTIKYRLVFAGNAKTPIKAQVTFSQNNVVLSNGVASEEGSTDEQGVAVRSKEHTFNA
jgi:hypothetical protein